MSDDSDRDNFPKFGLNSDTSSNEDYLGFEPYVMAVKEFITSSHTEPPLTISIEGDWGSGKTTFMNILRDSLEDSEHNTVRFNPWRHEDKEAVWAAFASELIRELKRDTSICKKSKANFEVSKQRYWSNTTNWEKAKSFLTIGFLASVLISLLIIWLSVVLHWIFEQTGLPVGPANSLKGVFGFGGAFGIIIGYSKIIDRFKKDVVQPVEEDLVAYASDPGYDSKTDFVSEFHEDFETILDAYLEEDERIFIFIDDLDRCSVPRAADLMQSINLLMSDDDRLVFILGLDRERVAAGVAAKHEEILTHLDQDRTHSDLEFGYQYLEKFIQIPFLVPEPKEEDIKSLITGENEDSSLDDDEISNLWSEIEDELEENIDEIVDMAAPALKSNPRQIKRFVNLFQLRAVLAHLDGVLAIGDVENDPSNVSLHQLAKFVIISVQWPQLISKMYNDIDALDRLVAIAKGEFEGSSSDLEPWASEQTLLDLLSYGDGETFDIRNKQIGSLIKISPRADRPTKTSDTDEYIDRKIDISIFADESNRFDTILNKVEGRLRNNAVDILPNYYSVYESNKIDISRAFYGPAWIVNPGVLGTELFDEMVDSLPNKTLVLVYSDQSDQADELRNLAGELQHQNIRFVDGPDNLEQALAEHIGLIAKSENEWESWRRQATTAQDDFLHGF